MVVIGCNEMNTRHSSNSFCGGNSFCGSFKSNTSVLCTSGHSPYLAREDTHSQRMNASVIHIEESDGHNYSAAVSNNDMPSNGTIHQKLASKPFPIDVIGCNFLLVKFKVRGQSSNCMSL
jgi:hypothetical protein